MAARHRAAMETPSLRFLATNVVIDHLHLYTDKELAALPLKPCLLEIAPRLCPVMLLKFDEELSRRGIDVNKLWQAHLIRQQKTVFQPRGRACRAFKRRSSFSDINQGSGLHEQDFKQVYLENHFSKIMDHADGAALLLSYSNGCYNEKYGLLSCLVTCSMLAPWVTHLKLRGYHCLNTNLAKVTGLLPSLRSISLSHINSMEEANGVCKFLAYCMMYGKITSVGINHCKISDFTDLLDIVSGCIPPEYLTRLDESSKDSPIKSIFCYPLDEQLQNAERDPEKSWFREMKDQRATDIFPRIFSAMPTTNQMAPRTFPVIITKQNVWDLFDEALVGSSSANFSQNNGRTGTMQDETRDLDEAIEKKVPYCCGEGLPEFSLMIDDWAPLNYLPHLISSLFRWKQLSNIDIDIIYTADFFQNFLSALYLQPRKLDKLALGCQVSQKQNGHAMQVLLDIQKQSLSMEQAGGIIDILEVREAGLCRPIPKKIFDHFGEDATACSRLENSLDATAFEAVNELHIIGLHMCASESRFLNNYVKHDLCLKKIMLVNLHMSSSRVCTHEIPSVNQVDFYEDVEPESVGVDITGIASKNTLTSITISEIKINAASIPVLFEQMRKNQNLKTFRILDLAPKRMWLSQGKVASKFDPSKLMNTFLVYILQSLCENTAIEELELSGVNVDTQSFVQFLSALVDNNGSKVMGLKRLTLRDNHLQLEEFTEVGRALAGSGSGLVLDQLDLRGNAMDGNVTELVEVFRGVVGELLVDNYVETTGWRYEYVAQM